MQVTINIEVPAEFGDGPSAVRGALGMVEQFTEIEVREHRVIYEGPSGPVDTRVVVARFNWEWGRLIPPFDRLSYAFKQDCLAAQWRDNHGGLWQELYGPRRDKWLPFNPDYFIEF